MGATDVGPDPRLAPRQRNRASVLTCWDASMARRKTSSYSQCGDGGITPKHRNYDNAGPDIPGLKKVCSPDADTVADGAVADMIAFDRLGPLTRAAITGMCVQLSALGVLQLIRLRYPGMHESNQQVDREIATMLRLAEQDILKLIDRA